MANVCYNLLLDRGLRLPIYNNKPCQKLCLETEICCMNTKTWTCIAFCATYNAAVQYIVHYKATGWCVAKGTANKLDTACWITTAQTKSSSRACNKTVFKHVKQFDYITMLLLLSAEFVAGFLDSWM